MPGTAARAANPDARRRAARLELRFDDPCDAANPLGFRAVLAADAGSEPLAAAEELLDDEGFGAELVPLALGGRLRDADQLTRVLRPVFRRDVALAFGYGITSLFAAAPVFAAGSPHQRERMARLLVSGGRAAIVHRSLAHGTAMLRGELTAVQHSGGFLLDGRKDVVVNAERAGAVVAHVRTDPAPGAASHSVLLLDPGRLPADGMRVLGRRPTVGLRGCRFAGYAFDACEVPGEALVGEVGEGVRLALRTFQLNRTLITGAVVASVDTVLRAAVRTALAGRTLGRRQRGVLAGVFADLLACDAMATAVLRALSLLPGAAHLAAAELKYLVPDLLRDDLEELATVLGAGGYSHDTDQGMLGKLLRDLPAAGLGHAGTASCQAVVIPQLPVLARHAWGREAEPPAALFDTARPLPHLDIGALAVAGGGDFLTASLTASAARLADRAPEDPYGGVVRAMAAAFHADLLAVRAACRRIEPGDRAALASPATAALADRHSVLAAAGAALAAWEHHRGGAGFLADPAWLVLALHRHGRRLGLTLPPPPPDCVDRVTEELLARFRAGRSFDLHHSPLAEAGTP
ncbi:acyl-CoA dehydrogenase [Streptomyces sp. ICN988]|uniref:acyl-CoA dehydrogenase n=1 Tax=Streptomyces sp. ICN988 TaxID=2983765 RepID=UPI0021E40F03|nr:acyl-CoA dehydrogenase [Streptomyces sp. ICN988]MCV2458454.1 acyl-CoA dehydrogenase [Streptomyces sp. ICN988]